MNTKYFYLGNNRYNYDWIHLVEQYKHIVTKNDLVLEIGSSDAHKTKDLAKLCHRLIGLEKDANRIPTHPKTIGRKIVILNGDWRNLNTIFNKNKFNVVVASHVIEHVENDLSCINQTYDVLKSGGYFIFTTPNRDRLFERLRSVVLNKRKFPYHDHQREYTKADLLNLISKSKFNRCHIQLSEFVFGLHASPVHLFVKEVPEPLKGWVNFFEVIIHKT